MGLSHDPPSGEFCPGSGKQRMTRGQAKSLAKRRRGVSLNLQAYKCGMCGGWHVGNARPGHRYYR